MTPRIEILLDMIFGSENSPSNHQWRTSHNTALNGIPNEIFQTEGGEQKIFDYLMSRTSFGR